MKSVWIGGTGRCGTNLLKNLLNLSQETYSFDFEIRFIIDPDGLIDFYSYVKSAWSPQGVQIKLDRLDKLLFDLSERGGNYPDWELDEHIPNFSKLSKEYIDSLSDISFKGKWIRMGEENTIRYTRPMLDNIRKLTREYIENLLDTGKVYVDDGTYNLLYAHLIQEILPESKFIHMKRDPVQTIGSMLNQKWCPNDIDDVAIWYYDTYSRVTHSLSQVDEKKVLTIRMEELIQRPEDIMDKVCDFIGITKIPAEKINAFDLSKAKKYTLAEEDIDSINKIIEN